MAGGWIDYREYFFEELLRRKEANRGLYHSDGENPNLIRRDGNYSTILLTGFNYSHLVAEVFPRINRVPLNELYNISGNTFYSLRIKDAYKVVEAAAALDENPLSPIISADEARRFLDLMVMKHFRR